MDAASNESAPVIAQIQGADVTVLYQDENGAEIASPVVLKGNVGENFAAEIKAIAGYTQKASQTTGTFTDQAQTVIVSYTKVAPTEPEPEPTPKPDPAPKPDGTIVIPPEKEIVPNQPEKAPTVEKIVKSPENSEDKGVLPTTGDKSMDLAIVLGLVLSMLGVLILIRWKRRQI
nr:MucBP domain-containing protein [Listeria portnoyi]